MRGALVVGSSFLIVEAMIVFMAWLAGFLASDWRLILSILTLPLVLFIAFIAALFVLAYFGGKWDPNAEPVRRY